MKIIKETTIHHGPIFTLDQIDYENNFQAEVVKSTNAVCIAATLDGQNYFTVDQFRYGVDRILTEFPAGKIDLGETPLEAAHRELREEIGYKAKTLIPLGKVYSSPAMLSEILYLYYATDLEFVGQNLDDDEDLVIKTFSLNELHAKVLNNEIDDAKTIGLLYRLEHFLK